MKISMGDIVAATSAEFGISRRDILGSSRVPRIALPRQFAMFACRRLTPRSYPEIGAYFGRHHTTVLAAHRKFSVLITTHPEFDGHFRAIRSGATNIAWERARREADWVDRLHCGQISWMVG